MAQRAHTDPVFWWWDTERGAQVVVLTDEVLILSGVLTKHELGELEGARKAGNVVSANFGAGATTIDIDDVRRVRFVATEYRVLIDLEGEETPFVFDPPKASAGIAAGLFEVLNKLLAAGDTPTETIEAGAGPMSMTVGTKLSVVLFLLALAFGAGALVNPLSLIGVGIASGAFAFVILTDFGAETNALIPSGARVLESLISPGEAKSIDTRESERPAIAQHGPADLDLMIPTALSPPNEAVSTARQAFENVHGKWSDSKLSKDGQPVRSAPASSVHGDARVPTPERSAQREASLGPVKASAKTVAASPQAITADPASIESLDSSKQAELAASPVLAPTREFAKINDLDAPLPGWSMAREPADERVSPEAAERARPVHPGAVAPKPSRASD